MIANIIRQSGKALSVDYLVVAGGGSGGSGSTFNAAGGGGGAGGVLQGSTTVKPGVSYALTVGTGGATAAPFALGNNGTSSIFNTFTAVGGGAGASHTVQGQSPNTIAGSAGGSGGGGSGSTALGGTPGAGGAGTSGQGNAGGNAANNQPLNGGGGGGAGAAGGASATGTGARAGAGGAGVPSNITGNLTYYGGGGGGGIYCYNGSPYIGALQGLGGTGGGGNGSGNISTAGANGTANTGGGGGGGSTNDPSPRTPGGTNGGSGGSGIVILKCPSAYEVAEPSGLNYSSALSGGNRIYSFYSGTGNVTFQSAITDPYFSNVSLLLHMDGSNASTNFVDSGPSAIAVTAVGNAQVFTTQSKYGGASAYFDGTGDSLTIPANTALALGAGDYTIEGWFYSLTSGTSLRGMIDFRTSATGTNGLMLRENDGGFLVYLNSATLLSTTTGRVASQWQHVALVRKGTTVTLYVDGVSRATATSSTTLTDNILRVSGFVDTQSSVYTYNGYMDEIRISKYARYQSSFTPPTAAFPNS